MQASRSTTGSADRTSLLIVDDHDLSRAGLVMLFQTVPDIHVVGAAANAADALRLVESHRPDVVLMNVKLPKDDAFRTAREIVATCSRSRVLFLDDTVRSAHVLEGIRAGGSGYWTTYASFEEIVDAIRRVASGQFAFCPTVRSQVTFTPAGVHFRQGSQHGVLHGLTRREIEVLTYLAEGLSVKQCAQQMSLSRHTVDNHKTRLMKKLDVHKTIELVRLAIREGLVAG